VSSSLLNARLSRYALAVGAVAAATPTQAAPITVLLPTPVNILTGGSFKQFDVDNDGLLDINFSGSPFNFFLNTPPRTGSFGAAGGFARQLTEGVLIDIANTNGFWSATAQFSSNTAISPTFLAIQLVSGASAPQRVAFAQFSGATLYGFAWDQANTITTFDITAPATGVPEPATGALTALALGAVALAARKRKQA
jgi:hypothetical protein